MGGGGEVVKHIAKNTNNLTPPLHKSVPHIRWDKVCQHYPSQDVSGLLAY